MHVRVHNMLLCSPRGMTHKTVIKAALECGEILIKPENVPQFLSGDTDMCTAATAKILIMLYKKKYTNHIQASMRELLAEPDVSSTLDRLREELWHKTAFDNNHVPSMECINLRALNILYQVKLYRQCLLIQTPPNPLQYGWRKTDTGMEHIEDSEDNIRQRKSWYKMLMQKCGCRKNMCRTGSCSCKRAGNYCSRICTCTYCENTPEQHDTLEDEEGGEDIESSSVSPATSDSDSDGAEISDTNDLEDNDIHDMGGNDPNLTKL